MNVVSKELCCELYKLSNWTGSHAVWHDDTTISPLACGYEDITAAIHFTPAYDLGYLMRRIPSVIVDRGYSYYLSMEAMDDGSFTASYGFVEAGGGQVDAPSIAPVCEQEPEDAVAKLAIKLFEVGVLTRAAS